MASTANSAARPGSRALSLSGNLWSRQRQKAGFGMPTLENFDAGIRACRPTLVNPIPRKVR